MKENIFKPAIIGGICISALLFCSPLDASFSGPDSSSGSDSSESTESAQVNRQKQYFRICSKASSSLKGIGNTYPDLRLLHVVGCSITSLKEIDALPNLLELRVINEKVTSLEGIENFPNVQKINLSKNLIRSLAGIERLTKLEELNLSNNPVSFSELKKIKQLSNLQKVNITGNSQISEAGILFNSQDLPNYTFVINGKSYRNGQKIEENPLE